MIHEPSWIKLVDMAREAIDEHRYERAQALAAVVTAAATMQAAGALGLIADVVTGNGDDGENLLSLLARIAHNTGAIDDATPPAA